MVFALSTSAGSGPLQAISAIPLRARALGTRYVRNMQIHLLITLPARVMLHEPTATAFDLHAAARLALDVLDIASAGAHDLRAQVEARNGFEIDGNALFRPLAATERVTLDLWLFSAAEAALVDEVGEILLHKLINLLYRFLEAVFGRAGDVKVKGWVLYIDLACIISDLALENTHGCGGHGLVRVVVPAGCDIFIHVSSSDLTQVMNRSAEWKRTGASLLFDLNVTRGSAYINRGRPRLRKLMCKFKMLL